MREKGLPGRSVIFFIIWRKKNHEKKKLKFPPTVFSPLAKKIRQLLRLSLSLSGNILQTCCVRTLSLQVTPLSIFSPSVFPRFLFFYLATSLIPPMSNNMRQQVWLFHVCLVDRFLKRNEMEKERREATGGGGGRLESKSTYGIRMPIRCDGGGAVDSVAGLQLERNFFYLFCFYFIFYFRKLFWMAASSSRTSQRATGEEEEDEEKKKRERRREGEREREMSKNMGK